MVDPHIQRLVDELDHIGLSIPLDAVSGGLGQDDEPNSFVLTPNERYLSLYDLCSGDPNLVDTIRQANSSPLDTSLATSLLCTATPSTESNDTPFPPLNVGGKWVPGSLGAPTPPVLRVLPAPTAPITQACLLTPELAPALRRVCPSRRAKSAGNAGRSTSGRRRGHTRTQDYLDVYPAKAQAMRRSNGYRAMIRGGRWGPIIADALRQIGVPYPMMGLQKVLSELYDGEGEQEGWPTEAKDRPAYPWKVSPKPFDVLGLSLTVFTYRARSLGTYVSRRKGITVQKAEECSYT